MRGNKMAPVKTLSALIVLGFLSRGVQAQDCDRACLEGLVDDYLEAVIDNDPAAVPLAEDVRFTENGQRLLIGDGLWNTMKAKGGYRIFVTDVEAGQVAFLGTIAEDHREPDQQTPALLALRLRWEDGAISEVEQMVVRDARAAERVEQATPHPSYTTVVPEDARMSREELIVTANRYFAGMQRNDGKGDYPFAENCNRFENGNQTTNVPVPPGETRADPATATTYSAQWSCLEQFESGLIFFVNRIRDRRFVAVDQERGLVFTFVFFDHSGGEFRKGVRAVNGEPVVAGPVQPWTWYIAELFKIEDGLIHQIDAILERAPYGMNSGWSTWEEGMSDRIQDVTFADD